MDRKILKVKMKADYVSDATKNTAKKIYAEKNEILKVNTQRGDVLILKGKREVFPINIKLVDVVEYEKQK